MAKSKPSGKGRRTGLRLVLLALLLLALGGLAASLLGAVYPVLDLANIVLVPCSIAAIVLAFALASLTRRWLKRTIYALVMLGAAWLLIPPPSAIGQCAGDAPRVKVAWLNLQGSTAPQPILDWLEREQPDIVGFGELHASVEPTRSMIAARYPHSQSCLANGRCSTILYTARLPLASAALSRGDVQNRQALSAARMTLVTGEDQALNIVAVHLSRAPYVHRQKDELRQLQLLLDKPADTVIIGDFNMVRRMHGLRSFAQSNGFASTPADRATWPLWWQGRSVWPVLQIDHVLAGRNWRVETLRTSDDLGPDHRGIVAELCRAV